MSTLNSLTVKRIQLSGELSSHCISDHHGCYDLARAKDFLRSYVCLFYELLKKDYSEKITIWDWEQQIAEEAIQITLKVWSSFEVGPLAPTWVETLRSAVVQHVGHPLRTHGAPVHLPPPSAYAASGIDIASASPLLKMVIAAGRTPALVERTQTADPSNRMALRDAYRAAFPDVKIADIIWAAKQTRREWTRWITGKAKDGLKPDRSFKHVLTSGKNPEQIMGKPRPTKYTT